MSEKNLLVEFQKCQAILDPDTYCRITMLICKSMFGNQQVVPPAVSVKPDSVAKGKVATLPVIKKEAVEKKEPKKRPAIAILRERLEETFPGHTFTSWVPTWFNGKFTSTLKGANKRNTKFEISCYNDELKLGFCYSMPGMKKKDAEMEKYAAALEMEKIELCAQHGIDLIFINSVLWTQGEFDEMMEFARSVVDSRSSYMDVDHGVIEILD